jgi:hypothetical protein
MGNEGLTLLLWYQPQRRVVYKQASQQPHDKVVGAVNEVLP